LQSLTLKVKEGGWSANTLNILYKDVRYSARVLFFFKSRDKGQRNIKIKKQSR
jgi:hypothetical protein